jgi:hypothetical protein
MTRSAFFAVIGSYFSDYLYFELFIQCQLEKWGKESLDERKIYFNSA